MRVLLVALLCVAAYAAVASARIPGVRYDENFREVLPHEHLLQAFALGADPRTSGRGGGSYCAGCTIIVSIVEQLAVIHYQTTDEALEMFCSYLPTPVSSLCDFLVDTFGEAIINGIEMHETPDTICQQLGVCTLEVCHLFPYPSQEVVESRSSRPSLRSLAKDYTSEEWQRTSGAIIDWINRFVNDHDPFFDFDGDRYSTFSTLRGYSFRGQDCDDASREIYPGRNINNFTAAIDHNCNGIYGVNKNSTWEDVLCEGTPHFGQAILGDSAAAHFHIPPDWVTPSKINKVTFDSLIPILENEFDWPEMSATTGYGVRNWIGHPIGPINSTYLNSLNNNRCIMRDYQNCGVNGARTSSMADNIMYSFARNQTLDDPVILMYALIGNDVCNPHPGFSHMTTPTEFYDNVVTAMEYLDTQLPYGSHVVFMGLADGLLLYETMANRTYPIGELRNDVTYGDVYDYLNCLEISPCFGWLNRDEAIRIETQIKADNLTLQYEKVIENNSYEHFDMHFIPCPVRDLFDIWEEEGGQGWELIEIVDGFHPNQNSNALIAKWVWETFTEKFPELIQPVNPNNDMIQKLFGDQGGY